MPLVGSAEPSSLEPRTERNRRWPREVLSASFEGATSEFRRLMLVTVLTGQRIGDVCAFERGNYDSAHGRSNFSSRRQGGRWCFLMRLQWQHCWMWMVTTSSAVTARPTMVATHGTQDAAGCTLTLASPSVTRCRVYGGRHRKLPQTRERTARKQWHWQATAARVVEVYFRDHDDREHRRRAVHRVLGYVEPIAQSAQVRGNTKRLAGVTGAEAAKVAGIEAPAPAPRPLAPFARQPLSL